MNTLTGREKFHGEMAHLIKIELLTLLLPSFLLPMPLGFSFELTCNLGFASSDFGLLGRFFFRPALLLLPLAF